MQNAMTSAAKIAKEERAGITGDMPLRKWLMRGATVYMSAVFLDSLRFKFTNAPKTQVIFGDLDAWASGFGAAGLFAPTGLFSQYVIGTAELAASAVLLTSMFSPRYRFLQPLGAMLALAIMTGAISFHLFTPLGVNVAGDGGSLFFAACGVWICAVFLLALGRRDIAELGRRLAETFRPLD